MWLVMVEKQSVLDPPEFPKPRYHRAFWLQYLGITAIFYRYRLYRGIFSILKSVFPVVIRGITAVPVPHVYLHFAP